MPNSRSAKKRLRNSEKANVQNTAVRTQIKSTRRKLFEAVDAKDAKTSTEVYQTYCSVLDKAAKHGVIKKNAAVRRKGRADQKIRALSA